jgi:hypothetical protein
MKSGINENARAQIKDVSYLCINVEKIQTEARKTCGLWDGLLKTIAEQRLI